MGVYIKGMEMPHEGYCNIRLYPNGKVSVSYFSEKFVDEAVEVKAPHGRLIDADAAMRSEQPSNVTDEQWAQTTLARCIINAPTIIEAEGNDG